MTDGDGNGPLSWRDVYKAVNDAETRILTAVREASLKAEDRSGGIEQRVAANAAQIRSLEQWQLSFSAATQGKNEFLGSLRSVVMLTLSIIVGFSAAIGILTAIFRIFGIAGQ